ncbi:disulfide bond formation protein DsbA [Cohnella sp. CIP 111063]|jgi:predicted DsbA family dithiol-disulfide isomerase|uniref:DsbA family oxidoreductase n=1 Tax=unclassified Cohnella TaxID=2636738 RepID=UPI000B8C11BC|nr:MULTISPECIES: DsbA family oxidoreductase [unclassified Cohnella]OXS57745.1 disulfide bond formation protein DsbA [Cohnella sp. CIP 111063]PRX71141.1 putative DsbA family dithiol-disulfide isomerase [Cohnella sp. SGD-V74]
MKIDVYSDMVCPWCRIGKKNMNDAIDAWQEQTGQEVEVSYHAYQLDPSLPPEGLPFNSVMEKKMGGAERLRPMLQRVTEAGANVGVTFHFDKVERMPNTVLAHRITALLPQEDEATWIEAVMKAYFEDGRDIAKLDVLLDIAAELGLDASEARKLLDNGEGQEDVEKDMAAAQGIGITGVPFFIIDNKYALSGAYPSAQFLEAFKKIAQGG